VSRALWPTARIICRAGKTAPRAGFVPADDAGNAAAVRFKAVQARVVADLAAQPQQLSAQIGHHGAQDVRSDVGLVPVENVTGRAELDETFEHEADAAVSDAGGELSVGKGARAALAELDVRARVENPRVPEALHGSARFSTGAPRSRISGAAPARASASAAKSPAGPMPTTTGRQGSRAAEHGNSYGRSAAAATRGSRTRRSSLVSSSILMSTE
jgi:hypothetical protein